MNTKASTVDALFEQAGDKRITMESIDRLIQTLFPDLEVWLLKSTTYTMIGYGRCALDRSYPLFSLAPQKQYTSLYVLGEKDGELYTSIYKEKLGKVQMGKSCIRIRDIAKVDMEELANLLLDCREWNDRQ